MKVGVGKLFKKSISGGGDDYSVLESTSNFSVLEHKQENSIYSWVPNTRGVLINRGRNLLKKLTNEEVLLNGGGEKFVKIGILRYTAMQWQKNHIERWRLFCQN